MCISIRFISHMLLVLQDQVTDEYVSLCQHLSVFAPVKRSVMRGLRKLITIYLEYSISYANNWSVPAPMKSSISVPYLLYK
jgi:hypothetical protein